MAYTCTIHVRPIGLSWLLAHASYSLIYARCSIPRIIVVIVAGVGIFPTMLPLSHPRDCHFEKLTSATSRSTCTAAAKASALVCFVHVPVQSEYSFLKVYPASQVKQSVGFCAFILHVSQCQAGVHPNLVRVAQCGGPGGDGASPVQLTISLAGSPDGVRNVLLAYCIDVEEVGSGLSHCPL
eukprot:COSAG02_NODE_206_length_29144_cov_12.855121_18_plen_182_part_00